MIKHFSHARTAFKYGLKTLNIQKEDEILIPDFNCDVMLHPFSQLKIKYNYYEIDNQLKPDWHKLEKLITVKTKAVLMVHYFGQPQNIEKFRNFCNKHKLFLIEDNAHGHGGKFNDKILGTFGDIGISSPRKIINTQSGGILFNNTKIDFNFPQLPPYPISNNMNIIRNYLNYFPNFKLFLKKIIRKRPLYEDPKAFRELEILDYSVDEKSQELFNLTNWGKIIRDRQICYYKWQDFALSKGLKPVYDNLYPLANPWCFPAYTKSKDESAYWYKWGWKNNKLVFSWPTLPNELIYRDSSTLDRWKKLICFSTLSF